MAANSATSSNPDDPLASDVGMVREALESAKHYPLIFVVVDQTTDAESLQQLFMNTAKTVLSNNTLILPRSEVRFGSAAEAEVFRGTIPVFVDPNIYRGAKAA